VSFRLDVARSLRVVSLKLFILQFAFRRPWFDQFRFALHASPYLRSTMLTFLAEPRPFDPFFTYPYNPIAARSVLSTSSPPVSSRRLDFLASAAAETTTSSVYVWIFSSNNDRSRGFALVRCNYSLPPRPLSQSAGECHICTYTFPQPWRCPSLFNAFSNSLVQAPPPPSPFNRLQILALPFSCTALSLYQLRYSSSTNLVFANAFGSRHRPTELIPFVLSPHCG